MQQQKYKSGSLKPRVSAEHVEEVLKSSQAFYWRWQGNTLLSFKLKESIYTAHHTETTKIAIWPHQWQAKPCAPTNSTSTSILKPWQPDKSWETPMLTEQHPSVNLGELNSVKTTSMGRRQLCLDQGKWQEWKQKCITSWELLLNPSETDTCSLHTEPEGSPRAEHIPEKRRLQLAGQSVEQFLWSWRANPKSSYLAEIKQPDLHVQISTWQWGVLQEEK